MMAVVLFASLTSQTHNTSANCFKYTCPMRYTESDLCHTFWVAASFSVREAKVKQLLRFISTLDR